MWYWRTGKNMLSDIKDKLNQGWDQQVFGRIISCKVSIVCFCGFGLTNQILQDESNDIIMLLSWVTGIKAFSKNSLHMQNVANQLEITKRPETFSLS